MGMRRSLPFLALLLMVPVVAAQEVPPVPSAQIPTVPDLPIPADPTVLLDDGPLLVQGSPTHPTLIRVMDPNGTAALTYSMGTDGRARVLVGEELVLEDATLARMDGAPTDAAFTLRLHDVHGAEHSLTVDRAALLAAAPEVAPVQLLRPPAWPGAPEEAYLLYVQDARPNRLGADDLGGSGFLRRADEHMAVLQIPTDNATWDRIALSYSSGANATANATFLPLASPGDAVGYRATFAPNALLGIHEGDMVTLRVLYERRLSPLVVERFPENATYQYRVDGRGPSVTLEAPATSNDFRFALEWGGSDDLTGVRGFAVDVRPRGSATWTRWLDGTDETSAVFSGEWATTYEFRAYSLDGVGNPSQPATATVAVGARPEGNDEVNRAPTARILSPTGAATLRGLTTITWQASDPDGTPVTSRLEVSADDGATSRILYVGTGTSYAWHTDDELDGATYRLRLTVSDGTAQASDAASAITIDNVAAPASAPLPTTGGTPATTTGAPTGGQTTGATATTPTDPARTPTPPKEPADGKAVPGAGIVAALAIVGAALVWRRRA